MTVRAGSVAVAHPLYQGEGGGSIPTSALQLRLHKIGPETAIDLNRKWHSRLPRIGDPIGPLLAGIHYAAEFDGIYYAVAMWTHPVNRSLPQNEWLELRRLAISADAPRNTASRMLAVMSKLIRRERPEITRLISYQDTEVHTGGIYRAAGWLSVDTSKSTTDWNTKEATATGRTEYSTEASLGTWDVGFDNTD